MVSMNSPLGLTHSIPEHCNCIMPQIVSLVSRAHDALPIVGLSA